MDMEVYITTPEGYETWAKHGEQGLKDLPFDYLPPDNGGPEPHGFRRLLKGVPGIKQGSHLFYKRQIMHSFPLIIFVTLMTLASIIDMKRIISVSWPFGWTTSLALSVVMQSGSTFLDAWALPLPLLMGVTSVISWAWSSNKVVIVLLSPFVNVTA